MSYKNVFREISREYEASRALAEARAEARREEAYRKVPRLYEIDQSLAETGLSLSRVAMTGDKAAINKARAAFEALKKERLVLLKKNQMDEKCFSVPYVCESCKDTGYISTAVGRPAVVCACFKQRLINEYYSLSNMNEVLREENFDSFDIRLFSGEINENEGLSPRANMEMNYRIAINFVEKFDEEFQNLLFFGNTGLGKTFLCHCIAKDLLDAGKTVLYLTVPRLCRMFEDARFNRDSLSAPDEMLEAVDEAELLVLDDLGTEISTVITSAVLFDIINQRILTRKSTVISTNLSMDTLSKQYSARMYSRIIGNYVSVKFFGEDIRVKKRYSGLRIS